MFARVNTAKWNPESYDRAMKLTEEMIIPAYEAAPGFGGYVLLLDPDNDTGVAITMWETKADMEASESIAREMTGELRGILAEPPVAERYEVAFDVRP